jgi:hypothetical protein
MGRRALAVIVTAFLALPAAGPAAAAVAAPEGAPDGEVQHFLDEQTVVRGFFRGRTVRYLDLGPVKLAPGNAVAPIWVVTNGTPAQRNIIDVVPGRDGYTPLWRVTMVTWKRGITPRTLRSAAAVRAAVRAGQVRLKRTAIVVNCPVLGFGQLETLGFYKGQTIAYLDLGPINLRPGNTVAPIWAVTNGTADQRNVIDVVPGDDGYTPLWAVRMVTWRDGTTPRTLRSAEEVEAALAAGEVTIVETDIVVNCPVV